MLCGQFQSDAEQHMTDTYNIKQRKSSVGETIQNFIKEKLHKSPIVEEKDHRGTEPGTSSGSSNRKSGERRTSIADFLKSPLDITKKRNRSQSLPHTQDSLNQAAAPEIPGIEQKDDANERSTSRMGMFSPKIKNKRTLPVKVSCNG